MDVNDVNVNKMDVNVDDLKLLNVHNSDRIKTYNQQKEGSWNQMQLFLMSSEMAARTNAITANWVFAKFQLISKLVLPLTKYIITGN